MGESVLNTKIGFWLNLSTLDLAPKLAISNPKLEYLTGTIPHLLILILLSYMANITFVLR
jgi:hypothetical protein